MSAFQRAGLPSALQDYLLDPKHMVLDTNSFTVFRPA